MTTRSRAGSALRPFQKERGVVGLHQLEATGEVAVIDPTLDVREAVRQESSDLRPRQLGELWAVTPSSVTLRTMQASTAELVGQIVSLRRVRAALDSPVERRRLAQVIRQLRRQLGSAVPKSQAAAALGVTVQALDRWVADGSVAAVRRPGSSRELIDSEALLALAAEVAVLRERGVRRPLAKAISMLNDQGRLRRRLRPNQSGRQLRDEFLHSTAAGRLREGIELSQLGASLAANAQQRMKARVKQ